MLEKATTSTDQVFIAQEGLKIIIMIKHQHFRVHDYKKINSKVQPSMTTNITQRVATPVDFQCVHLGQQKYMYLKSE